jgi:hypothetical protein
MLPCLREEHLFSYRLFKNTIKKLKRNRSDLIPKKQQGNPRVALPNLTLNKHHPEVMFSYSIQRG